MRGIGYTHFRSVKYFPDPDSGYGVGVLKRKSKILDFSTGNHHPPGMISGRNFLSNFQFLTNFSIFDESFSLRYTYPLL
jgi:hypothetical protein